MYNILMRYYTAATAKKTISHRGYMKYLVTGGTGYIGSHVVVELINRGIETVIVDDLSNSDVSVVDRIEKITGVRPIFIECDICDILRLDSVFKKHQIDTVLHFAGKKSVAESVALPLLYYKNNLLGLVNLLQCMGNHKVNNLVFSSSATVYGASKKMPVDENSPLGCTNPYGWTKLMIEEVIKDYCVANPKFNAALLRYFNPVGAHSSGLIGECPNGIPNNLAPYILQVASGKLPHLNIYGNDYDTPDGTGVRDYIHVCDLAEGHIAAIDKLHQNCGLVVYNLGTGRGYSVLQVLHAFEKAVGRQLPYVYANRRPGDIATCYAVTDKAKKELNFVASRGIDEMARDSWKWQQYLDSLSK